MPEFMYHPAETAGTKLSELYKLYKSSELSECGQVRLIALDLDGTLLNSDKTLTSRSRAALTAASRAGIEIVPATGRFYMGMPEVIRELPFVRYAITINGAQVFDVQTGESVYSADIPLDEALSLFSFLDTLPVIYDCYVDNWGYMTENMWKNAEDYISYIHSLHMVRDLRTPVPELKAFLKEQNRPVQKAQLFTRDTPLRDRLVGTLAEKYPRLAVTTSLPNNIEINSCDADKGKALLALAEYLQTGRDQTMAFGDGLNDLSMIRTAGTGVAMANAHPDVKAAANLITDDCDSDGVAKVIEQLFQLAKND